MAEPTPVEVRALLAVSRDTAGTMFKFPAYPPALNEPVQFDGEPGRDFVVVDRALWLSLLEAMAEKMP